MYLHLNTYAKVYLHLRFKTDTARREHISGDGRGAGAGVALTRGSASGVLNQMLVTNEALGN